jgi:DNA polymerase III delta prime subunit
MSGKGIGKWHRSQPLARFAASFETARQPRPKPIFEPRAQHWNASFKHAEKRLDKLFKHPGRNLEDIRQHLHRIEFFLKQDPLYFPYLFNEIADMAGLARATARYQPSDQVRAKNVMRRALAKVREMDRVLAPDGRRAA